MPLGPSYIALLLAGIAYIGHATWRKEWLGWGGTTAMMFSWIWLTLLLWSRGWAAGHWPLSNRYEFTLCFLWATILAYLILEFTWQERRSGVFALAIILLIATFALRTPADQRALSHLLPALRSPWLQGHVLSTMVAYGAFALGSGLGLLRLTQAILTRSRPQPEPDWLPPIAETDYMLERTIALGFPWLTLGILTGAIWAQQAWGRYWGWDPKETWAFITWLWYLVLLHLRPLKRWRGTGFAILCILGFGFVLFTLIGVPWLVRNVRLPSLHGY